MFEMSLLVNGSLLNSQCDIHCTSHCPSRAWQRLGIICAAIRECILVHAVRACIHTQIKRPMKLYLYTNNYLMSSPIQLDAEYLN
jgi:hypothetical protein